MSGLHPEGRWFDPSRVHKILMWGGEEVTHEAHNLEIAGSIPAPATIVNSHEC